MADPDQRPLSALLEDELRRTLQDMASAGPNERRNLAAAAKDLAATGPMLSGMDDTMQKALLALVQQAAASTDTDSETQS